MNRKHTTNSLKSKLLSGRPAYGVSIMMPSPQLVEIVGLLGFDWVLIDCEHGPISLESVETLAIAADACGLTPIARPGANSPEAILQIMDRGVMGVQVPHICSAVEAQAVVEAVKFGPLGMRSLAVGTRSSQYGLGLSMSEYVSIANRETLVCIQIEDRQGLDNIEDIVKIEGVDVVFIGPSDLSQSLGYPGQPHVPAIQQAMYQAFTTIQNNGKIAGSAGDAHALSSYMSQGILYMYTHVTRLLDRASQEFFSIVNPAEKPHE